MPEARTWKTEIRHRTSVRDEDVIEELAQHLEDEYQRLLSGGTGEKEAYEMALAGFIDMDLRSVRRDVKPGLLLVGQWQDIRYATRLLTRNPGFALLAVLSLAFGIGGNAAIFSLVSAVLIQPLPYPHAERLVQAANDGYYPPGGLAALQRESRTMEVSGFQPGVDLNLTGQREPLRLTGSSVSANFFDVLGVGADVGRGFRPGDDQPARDNLVILSHAAWRAIFAGDPAVVGRVVTLGGVDRRVVGVMPPGFAFPDASTQFWIPLHLDPRDQNAYWARGFMPVIARLRDGVTLDRAQREIRSLTGELVGKFPYPMPRGWNAQATVLPLQQYMSSNIRTRLIVLQCAVGLVLLIGCVNVASLFLARATARKKEMAIRVALGAARVRIVRQLLTESLILALAGGAAGIILAFTAFSMLKLALPAGTVGLRDLHPSWQAVILAGALSLLTGVACGLAPALSASKSNLAGTIKLGGQRSSGSVGARLRSALIMGEVALAVVLAVGAGLLVKSLWMLAQVNPGFQPEHLLTLRVSPNESMCRQREACVSFYSELLRRASETSAVEEAAAANTVPLAAGIPALPVAVEGHRYVPGVTEWPMFWAGAVTPSYFHLMKIPILEGRAFSDSDQEKSAPVIVVSAAMAHRYWPGQDPIGKHVRAAFESHWRTVVGVAGDVLQYDLANHSPDYIRGAIYMPYAQSVGNDRQLPAAMTIMVRTNSDPALVGQAIRELVKSQSPDVPVSDERTMDSLVDDSTRQSRSMTWIFASFAGASLLLAAIGTYGVVSYSTAQRTFEIGIRVALGASRSNVFALVLGQSLRLVLTGLAVGIVLSLILTRMLTAFLYGTAATDPVTFLAVGGVLIAVALIAGYVPARRAASIDPLTALRIE